jgi:hypothetical protein
MAGMFHHISATDIGDLVLKARRRVVLAAPGIEASVAAALVNAASSIGPANVQVILDVEEDNCRVGYGDVDGYSILVEQGMLVRRCPGLRICFVLSDDAGYVFGMPPAMVEASSKLSGCPNAVRATPQQIEALFSAVNLGDATPGEADQTTFPLSSRSTAPEIGREVVSKADVQRIEENIRTNPVQDFDLGRVVRVFTTQLEFIELGVEGAELENHTIKLPPELLAVVRDKDTRERLTAAFKLVSEGSRLTGEKIRKAADGIRKRFIRTNSTYGGVMLKAKRADLECEIEKLRVLLEEHKQIVRERFAKEVYKSVKELVQAFWRAVQTSPPNDLVAQIATQKPTTEQAKAYLSEKLGRVFPDVKKL